MKWRFYVDGEEWNWYPNIVHDLHAYQWFTEWWLLQMVERLDNNPCRKKRLLQVYNIVWRQ